MDFEIRGRIALVTGASAGIGEAVALALAREGVRLAVAARRLDRLEVLAKRARESGASDARGFEFDQKSSSTIDAMLDDVHAAFGSIDILVLNGGGPKPGAFTDMAIEDWDAGYRAVLRSMLSVVDRVLPGMRANGWGRIVALTST
ncbi:MAG: SDR family NAD(P)-dependent oxidoreductase, partial [Candidatus Eremiobacteraeota bacterium]|nr:SDR family NAD(P)-dependent oxidoreductase [Candidatus Eremiobacteraeota bacterium]